MGNTVSKPIEPPKDLHQLVYQDTTQPSLLTIYISQSLLSSKIHL